MTVRRFRVDPDRSVHPDWVGRGKLAIRAAIAATLEMPVELDPDIRRETVALADKARSTLAYHADFGAGYSDLRQSVEDDVTAHQAAAIKAQQAAVPPQIDALLNALGRLDCSICPARGAGVPCTGDETTDKPILGNIDHGPSCLAFASDMFAQLVDEAEAFYIGSVGDATISPSGNEYLSLRLGLQPALNDKMGGKTVFPVDDDLANRCADITITLPVDHLSEMHLGELPYIIFHEIFVHGPESWPTAGRRAVTPTTCVLREGFVDAAAAEYLIDALKHGRLAFDALPQMGSKLAALVRQAQLKRINPSTTGLTPAARTAEDYRAQIRQSGFEAFDAFVTRDLRETGYSLAAALNLLFVPDATRAKYLALVKEAAMYMLPSTEALGSKKHAFAAKLRQIVDRRPINLETLARYLDAHLVIVHKGF